MNPSTAKIIEHSVAYNGVELVTMQLRYPRLVHAEFMTHRVFSRNASSSRAIPVQKMIDQVRSDPAMPIHWSKNQPGMQAREELTGSDLAVVKGAWANAANAAADYAEVMMIYGAHKQVANRILEPFQFINVIVTATEWGNFFDLRDHEDADPNIAELARNMRAALAVSTPTLRKFERGTAAGWHLPYVTWQERREHEEEPRLLAKISAARCARVSYLTHDQEVPDLDKDLALYERLVGGAPLHASPVEHQAYPLPLNSQWGKNFRGWHQHRSVVEREIYGPGVTA